MCYSGVYMKDQIFYCLPTYKSFDYAREGVLAALKGSIVPSKIIIIDNSGDESGTAALQDLTEIENVFIWPQTYNLGVARSWNEFHRVLDRDFTIIANDDVAVHYGTLEAMYLEAKRQPETPIIFGNGASGNAYSLFMLRRWAFGKIGEFDERFYPAYFEDNDYAYRLKLAGYLEQVHAHDATYDHVGSSTLKRYSPSEQATHHNRFRNNREYYKTKWGGVPGEEVYLEPFGDIL